MTTNTHLWIEELDYGDIWGRSNNLAFSVAFSETAEFLGILPQSVGFGNIHIFKTYFQITEQLMLYSIFCCIEAVVR